MTKEMNWYVYDDMGRNVAVVNASDLIEAQRAAKFLGYDTNGDYSIERA